MTAEDNPHRLDDLVRAVATRLPFPVVLDADVGYIGALFIDLGRRHRGGGEDAPDTASIDVKSEPIVWMFDVEGGRETISSTLGPDADPDAVAEWNAQQTYAAGSPVTRDIS